MTRPIQFDHLIDDPRSEARRGRLSTLHGVIETPEFMPVGTLASDKSLDERDLATLEAGIILNNA